VPSARFVACQAIIARRAKGVGRIHWECGSGAACDPPMVMTRVAWAEATGSAHGIAVAKVRGAAPYGRQQPFDRMVGATGFEPVTPAV
jgi:hypothetical protein